MEQVRVASVAVVQTRCSYLLAVFALILIVRSVILRKVYLNVHVGVNAPYLKGNSRQILLSEVGLPGIEVLI